MESIPNLISYLDSLIKEFAHTSLFPSSVIVSFITRPWTVMFSNLSVKNRVVDSSYDEYSLHNNNKQQKINNIINNNNNKELPTINK
jgi:hypothetical protein